MTYSVHDEPDYERTYDEDDTVTIRRGDLRALLDVATGSMDFGSGFLDNEQVEVLRKVADMLGVEPTLVTPSNFVCQYKGSHAWSGKPYTPGLHAIGSFPLPTWVCLLCHHTTTENPHHTCAEDGHKWQLREIVNLTVGPTSPIRLTPFWFCTACESSTLEEPA